MLFAMFALYGTPTIQKASCSAWGLWGDGAFSFAHSHISISIACNLDSQHWPTIVTHVLSNNLGMLGRILGRLTGMWDETILSRVVIESVYVRGNVIDLFILWQGCKTSMRFATVIRLQRDAGSLCGLKVGEGSFLYVAGLCNPSKPSKNVDKQIPEMKSSPTPGWICP